jgi:trimeric autotransporter adhesin
MLKRIAVIAGAVVALAAAPATAEGYPPGDNLITVSDTTPCPGDTVTVTAQTFIPGSPVEVSFDTTHLGSPVANADGVVTLEATIPEGTPLGEHIFTALGSGIEEADLHLTANVEVVSCDVAPTTSVATGGGAAGGGDSGGGGLAFTGSNATTTLLRVGLALAAMGGVLLAVATKRRRSAARHASA